MCVCARACVCACVRACVTVRGAQRKHFLLKMNLYKTNLGHLPCLDKAIQNLLIQNLHKINVYYYLLAIALVGPFL